MKKNIFISAALAFMALTSCQQENLRGNGAELDGFRVHTEDMTKAVLDGVKVVFEDEDAIDIYADNAETPAVYTYNKESDLFVSTGTEAEGAEYSAIFPSTATDPSRSKINIPWKQFATVNSFPKNAMYMAGTSTSKEIALKHLVGLWEIDLLPLYDSKKLVRADLTMNGGQNINGNFMINWTDNTISYVDGGRSAILLSGIEHVITVGEPVKLFFALPPGKYEGGFTFTATMSDGTIMEVTSPSTINIARGQITKVKNDVAYRLFAGGTGTETDPYIINTANHWKNIAAVAKINSYWEGKYFKVTADVDFNKNEIVAIPTFKGVIDGDGHTLSNAKIGSGSASHQAFFDNLAGTVMNLNFDNITVLSSNPSATNGAATSAAVIVSNNNRNAFVLDNCHVSNSSVTSGKAGDTYGSYAGGLVGRCNNANATIRNCSVTNTTISCLVENTGGVIGLLAAGVIENVKSSGNTITGGNRYVGGIAGNITAGTLTNIESTDNTITAKLNAGGVAGGMSDATLINAVSKNNTCTVASVSCGGVVGLCEGTQALIINVLSDGNAVKSTSHQNVYYLGGLIGGSGKEKTVATIANCIVLGGTADYKYDSTKDTSKPYAGGVGIALGYNWKNNDGVYEYIVSNSIIHQAYRTRFDLVWLAKDATKEYRRDAIGVKSSVYEEESEGGVQGNFTRYLAAPLKDGTALTMLNNWVETNKSKYPSLKTWTVDASNYPWLVLGYTATPSTDPLNVVESQY